MDFKANMNAYIAEALGTAILVAVGCGTAIVTGSVVATALAFGLTIVALAYSLGKISGCHVNPAISLAMFIDGRMKKEDFAMYVVFQFIGGLVGAALLYLILTQNGAYDDLGKDFIIGTGLGTNGFGKDYSAAAQLTMFGAILVEILLTFVFVLAALGVTSSDKYAAQGGLVIGLTLALVHFIGIGLTGTSVNPARSFGPAVFLAIAGESLAIQQVWVFIVAPLIGAAIAAFCWKFLKTSVSE